MRTDTAALNISEVRDALVFENSSSQMLLSLPRKGCTLHFLVFEGRLS